MIGIPEGVGDMKACPTMLHYNGFSVAVEGSSSTFSGSVRMVPGVWHSGGSPVFDMRAAKPCTA
jgi:hypothetical protein